MAQTLEQTANETKGLVPCQSRCSDKSECPYNYMIPKDKVQYGLGPYAICLERHERTMGTED